MPKDQSKKSHVKKSAKERAYENNTQDLDDITKELFIEWDQKKKLLKRPINQDDLNKEVVIGRIQLAHGFMFQVECKNKVLQVATPGNMALHDMIKQYSSGTHTNQELQPYILLRLPTSPGKKTGETLALISDSNPEITAFRLAKLENCGIDMAITKKETVDTAFEFEEEVQLEDL
jgi:hypothetical protein